MFGMTRGEKAVFGMTRGEKAVFGMTGGESCVQNDILGVSERQELQGQDGLLWECPFKDYQTSACIMSS